MLKLHKIVQEKTTSSLPHRHVIDEFAAEPDMTLRFVLADKPERHALRGLISHSGAQSCEVCTAVALTGPINWPFAHCHGKPERTHGQMKNAAE